MGTLQEVYKQVYDTFDGNELLISVVGSNIVMFCSFWILNSLLLFVDMTGYPKCIMDYKVQKDRNVPIDREKLKGAIQTALINTCFWNVLVSFITYGLQVALNCNFKVEEIPSWTRIIVDLSAFSLIQEPIFYYTHRLMHHPMVYKLVHKKHHEWTAPIGIISIYTHPVEYLTGNALTVLTGPLLMRSHIVVFWIWFSMATFFTSIHHSGYHLPFLPSPQFHDYHHLKFNTNFGTLGWLDKLHGTDRLWQNSIEGKRHRTLFGFTPMSRQYPHPGNKPENNMYGNGKAHKED